MTRFPCKPYCPKCGRTKTPFNQNILENQYNNKIGKYDFLTQICKFCGYIYESYKRPGEIKWKRKRLMILENLSKQPLL